MEDAAVFVVDGDSFVATNLAQGGWDPTAANGGTVLALVGQCLDDVPSLVPMTVSRVTADIVRPVPLGRRLHVVPTVTRQGKKIQVVQMQVLVDGVEHVRASVLRLRDADLSDSTLPMSTTETRPADALEPPEQSSSYRDISPHAPGFLRAVDMRRARLRDGSGVGIWLRLEVPIVAGRAVSPSVRLAMALDFANLIGVDVRSATATMINPDVTGHVLRAPSGDWIGITGETRFTPALGRGVTSAVLSDADGVFAVVSMCQLVQPQPTAPWRA
jgi:acyl-coenzyme A thioesterase PaaI-like protein